MTSAHLERAGNGLPSAESLAKAGQQTAAKVESAKVAGRMYQEVHQKNRNRHKKALGK